MEAKKLYISNVEYTVNNCFYEHPNFIFLVTSVCDGSEKRLQGKLLWFQKIGRTTILLLTLRNRVYRIEVQLLPKGMRVFFQDTATEIMVGFAGEVVIPAQSLGVELKGQGDAARVQRSDSA